MSKSYYVPSNRTDASKVKFKDENFPNVNNVKDALKELNNKTNILPNKQTVYIMKNAIPSGSVSSVYARNYLFDDIIFPNTEEIKSVYCEVVYIDNDKEITKNIKLEYIDNTPLLNEISMKYYLGIDEDDNFGVAFCSHYYAESEIEKCNISVCIDLENNTCGEVKKATISYETYSNLLKNEYIESVDYSKIVNTPKLSFDEDGNLEVIIDGIARKFQKMRNDD